jgi:glycine amidinotransferase
MSILQAVNSYDEWSRLREVVVGVGDNYSHHDLDPTFKLFYYGNLKPLLDDERYLKSSLALPDKVIDELLEDVEGIVEALESAGVSVLRPIKALDRKEFITPYWRAWPTPALNIRDQTLILGDTIVETAPHIRSRYFENDYLKSVFYHYFKLGSKWMVMPRPTLARGTLDSSYFVDQGVCEETFADDPEALMLGDLGYEIVFDGAQCIRFGKDILVNVANRNHELAFKWLNVQFAEHFNFHRLYRMSESHIDSFVIPLRPGTLLLRSYDCRRFLPDPLQKWDVIVAPEVSESRFPDYGKHGFNLASRYIDINVLSLDEQTVMVNSLYPELISTLEKNKFDILPVLHRHRRLFTGGFHCFTLDCVRDGGYESYFG